MNKKILFISQYFYPEEFRGNDIVFDWSKRGYDVTVVTAIPNYPNGKFFDGYGVFRKRKETIKGVKTIRVPVVPRGKGTGFMLMLNYLSYALSSSLYCFFHSFLTKYDLVFVQQLSPVTMALPALVVKKLKKTPLIIWVLDLWPESLISAGNFKNKFVIIFFEYFVRHLYRNSDKILISSKGFESSILKKGNFLDKILYLPNWAEDSFLKLHNDIKIPTLPNGFKIMFAGNIGEAQDFENIMKAALLLNKIKEIKFIILGDGRKKAWVQNFCNENNLNDTVFCLGRYPLETMPFFFKEADVMMVSLKNELIFNLTVPAKIQAYMFSGKPIIGMMNGEGANIIRESGCGICVNASDYETLSKIIIEMSKMKKEELNKMGQAGYLYALKNFNKDDILEYLNNIISKDI